MPCMCTTVAPVTKSFVSVRPIHKCEYLHGPGHNQLDDTNADFTATGLVLCIHIAPKERCNFNYMPLWIYCAGVWVQGLAVKMNHPRPTHVRAWSGLLFIRSRCTPSKILPTQPPISHVSLGYHSAG